MMIKEESAAQKIMQSLGLSSSYLYGTITSLHPSFPFHLWQTHITYFPRFNFIENKNSSVSIGLPLGVGVGIPGFTSENNAGIVFTYNLPVCLDYNIGCRSGSKNDKGFGGYLGVGFGYNKAYLRKDQYQNFDGICYGPLIRGGLRIGSSKNAKKRGFTFGVFYKKGLEKDKLSNVGLNILYDL